MAVRGLVERPSALSEAELDLWGVLEGRDAPFVIGDSYGLRQHEEVPSLWNTSWCSLYSLAVLLLQRMSGNLPLGRMEELREHPAEENSLSERFAKRANAQRAAFRNFLRNWNLRSLLNLQPARDRHFGSEKEQYWHDDRVLGLHTFESFSLIERYVLLWKANRETAGERLSGHRMISSRGVDLICSELLSNAFDHGHRVCSLFDREAVRDNRILHEELESRNSAAVQRILALCKTPQIYARIRDLGDVSKKNDSAGKVSSILSQLISDTPLYADQELVSDYPLSGDLARRLVSLDAQGRGKRLELNSAYLEFLEPGIFTRKRPFIMAKILRKESAALALKLDRMRDYLTESEKKLYESAISEELDYLQIVIGDSGPGFGGNRRLAALYRRAGRDGGDEGEVIKYALRPEVSTKKGLGRLQKQWTSYFADEDGAADSLIPRVHGLSEVQLFVKELRGLWRIHSNGTIVDLHSASDGRGGIETSAGRTIRGCLHYLSFPIAPQGFRKTIFATGAGAKESKFKVLDASNFLFTEVVGKAGGKKKYDWRIGVKALRHEILRVSGSGVANHVLLHLSGLDSLPEEHYVLACAVIADTLHRTRGSIGIFVSGASDKTRSLLRRAHGWSRMYLDRRVVPFISLFSEKGEFGIELGVPPDIEPIRKELERILSPADEHGLDLVSHPDRDLYEEVALHNSGLFELTKYGSDVKIVGTAKIDPAVAEYGRLIFGGRHFKEVREFIVKNRALRAPRGGVIRRRRVLDVYIHMAYLWADEGFQERAMQWLPVAAKNLCNSKCTRVGQGVVFLPVLHPAIDIAHRLVRDPEFAEADLIEVAHLSDIRWDSEPFLRVAKKQVICILDVVSSRETLGEVRESLRFVDAQLLGTLALLSIRSKRTIQAKEPLFAYSEAHSFEVKQLGEGFRR